MVLPQAMAMAEFHPYTATGKLNAVIIPDIKPVTRRNNLEWKIIQTLCQERTRLCREKDFEGRGRGTKGLILGGFGAKICKN